MKSFDIEKAKAGARVVTRKGKPVRILCYDLKAANQYKLVAAVSDSTSLEYLDYYTAWGTPFSGYDFKDDLMLADDD